MIKLTLLIGFALAAFFKFRVLPDMRAHRGIKKMDSDHLGNYDLDGVSYDPAKNKVVVVGDSQAPEPGEHVVIVGEVVALHAPEQAQQRNLGA